MGNSYASTQLSLTVLNLRKRAEVKEYLEGVLECDCDLHENGPDYWTEGETGKKNERGDYLCLCEELGYETELDMIVGEAMKGKSIRGVKSFEKVLDTVLDALGKQDFWQRCEYQLESLGSGKVAIALITGGYDQYYPGTHLCISESRSGAPAFTLC
jgi:hypothetical protein